MSYLPSLRRGFSDFFRLPAITAPASIPAVEAETDPDSPLYTLPSITGDNYLVSGLLFRLKPSDAHLWLGAVKPPGFTIKWGPEYREVKRGNTDEVSDITLAGINPIVEAELAYNGSAAIELTFAPQGGSNVSPPLLYFGNQSNTPNLLEPTYALLIISYNHFDPGYARLRVFFRGAFSVADYIEDIDHQAFAMEYRAFPGIDGSSIPFQNDRRYGARWSVATSTPGTPIAYR